MKIYTFSIGYVQANCYVIDCSDSCIVIDPGSSSLKQLQPIFELIDSLHKPNLSVLLTHGHFDHIMGVDLFNQKYNCDLYIFEDDLPFAKDSNLNQSFSILHKEYYVNAPLIALKDRQIITLGKTKIEVMHTPGHTTGSCCYLINDALFTGDTLFAGSIGRTDFPTGSYEQIINSLRLIKNRYQTTDIKVYPGHGCATTIQVELQNNIYFR